MDYEILIIEDDKDIRETLGELIHSEGYSIRLAEDGLKALQALEEGVTKPDLILVDLMMPRMSGKEFIKKAREALRLKNIPIIVMSALSDTEAQASELDVTGVLKKTLEVADLFSMIHKILPPQVRRNFA